MYVGAGWHYAVQVLVVLGFISSILPLALLILYMIRRNLTRRRTILIVTIVFSLLSGKPKRRSLSLLTSTKHFPRIVLYTLMPNSIWVEMILCIYLFFYLIGGLLRITKIFNLCWRRSASWCGEIAQCPRKTHDRAPVAEGPFRVQSERKQAWA